MEVELKMENTNHCSDQDYNHIDGQKGKVCANYIKETKGCYDNC